MTDKTEKQDANMGGREGGGDSGGGPYPNPHTGKTEKNEGFMAHGGQTSMAYHGIGQLGAEKVDEGNPNAVATERDDRDEGED